MKSILFAISIILSFVFSAMAQDGFETDVIKTSGGELSITFIGHGSLLLNYQNNNIYIDPYGKLADYSALPKADLIFLTHHHPDHLDQTALSQIRNIKTEVVLTEICAQQVKDGIVMKNGDVKTVMGIGVEAVPAYNLVYKRDNGQVFHPRGEGNGYVLSFGDKRLYVAGDTENTPEVKALKNIDYAFLPMNLPYTMTPEMVADTASGFSPKVLYPYHYGDTDPAKLVALLADHKEIELRIRKMK
ncbi:MAG: MBL fold metallo-hydrolase [Proteobacteria bacterium]|nr:MBL fold metallo-hydrolase [Pseudomonadota bacterium]MBU1714606.1 MBL fold metallo-hydrolase [Pseudomonadota bacterium]